MFICIPKQKVCGNLHRTQQGARSDFPADFSAQEPFGCRGLKEDLAVALYFFAVFQHFLHDRFCFLTFFKFHDHF